MEGYRIVSINDKNEVTTLTTQSQQEPQKVNIKIGTVETPEKTGLYLGTTKEFVKTYYTDLTDDSDLLLVYEFDEKDIKVGNVNDTAGEIIVSKAVLKAIFKLEDDQEVEFKIENKNNIQKSLKNK